MVPANGSINIITPITFKWSSVGPLLASAPQSVVYYHLQLSVDSLFRTTFKNDSTITDTSKTINVPDGMIFYWRVRARADIAAGAWSQGSKCRSELIAPTNLTVRKTGLAKISLEWFINGASIERYNVERKNGDTTSNDPYVIIGSPDAYAQPYIDTTVIFSSSVTNYSYRVVGIGSFDTSLYSNQKSVAITIPKLALAAPANASLNQPKQVGFSWRSVGPLLATSPSSVVRYHLQVSADTGFVSLAYNDTTITDTSKTVSLSDGKKYYWRVRAIADNIYGEYSNANWFITDLNAPDSLDATGQDLLKIHLAWKDKTENESGFIVERKLGDTSSTEIYSAIASLAANTVSFTDTTTAFVTQSTQYSYRVKAVNSVDSSLYSNQDWASIYVPMLRLASPQDGALNLTEQVAFTWNISLPDLSPKAKAFVYHLQVATDDAFTSLVVNDTTIADSAETVTLSDGGKYYWRVRAKGDGVYASFTPSRWFITDLKGPGSLTAKRNDFNKIILGWTDNTSKETGYIIERKDGDTASAAVYAAIASLPANSATFVDTTVIFSANVTRFSYRVQAANAVDSSLYSNQAFAAIVIPEIELISPASGARDLPSSVPFVWKRMLPSLSVLSAPMAYQLEVASDSGFTTVVFSDSAITDTAKTVTLSDGNKYFWRVRAKGDNVYGYYSEVSRFVTELNAPSQLTAQKTGLAKILLSWTNNTQNATSIVVERKAGDTSGVNSYSAIATLAPQAAEFTDTTVVFTSGSTQYAYRVYAANTVDSSLASNQASSAITIPPVTAVTPAGTTDLPVHVSFAWTVATPVAATPVTPLFYNLQISVNENFSTTVVNDTLISDTAASATLSDGIKYYWRVRAKADIAYGNWSNVNWFSTDLYAPDSLDVVSLDMIKMKLDWKDNTGNETGYIVERKLGDTSSTENYIVIASLPANTVSFTDTTVEFLTQNTQYSYRVKAFSSADTSLYSNQEWATIHIPQLRLIAPEAEQRNVPVTPVFRWKINVPTLSPKAASLLYHLQVATDESFTAVVFSDTTVTDSSKEVTLSDGVKYFWRVRAKGDNVYGEFTPSAWFITGLLAPDSLRAVNAGAKTVQLNWADRSGNESQYIIERKTGDSLVVEPFVVIATLGQNAVSYTDTASLENNTKYTYRIMAVNPLDSSGYCRAVIVQTLVSVDDANAGIPADFTLEQNYPNPFNPETVIMFSLPSEEYVKVVLYDISGTQIRVLADTRYAAGRHKLILSAVDLSSGVYVYTINAGKFSSVRKLTVLK